MTYDVQGQGHAETFGHHPDGSLWCDPDGCPGVRFQQAANFFEGTEDALDWFVSEANPLRGLLDADRIGLAGHSLGASAVTPVGNRAVPIADRPDIEVDAVVGWDNISLPATDPVTGVPLAPRVPTTGQNAEHFFNGGPLVWFDRHLKGGHETLPAAERLAQRTDAQRRRARRPLTPAADGQPDVTLSLTEQARSPHSQWCASCWSWTTS